MDDRDKAKASWMSRYYAPLVGATIEKFVVAIDDDPDFGREMFPMLIVKLADGTTAEVLVMRDEEGNGPGFLSGLPLPAQA